jgi:hypothetical protein
MHVAWRVLGPLKHHVLEEVGKSRPPGFFVCRTDVIPEVHGHHRQSVVFRQDDIEAILKRIFLEVDRGNVVRLTWRHGGSVLFRPARG